MGRCHVSSMLSPASSWSPCLSSGRGFNFGSEEKRGPRRRLHRLQSLRCALRSNGHICRGLACMRRSDYVQTRGRVGRERKGFCCGHDLSKVSQVNLVDDSQQRAEESSAAFLLGLRVVIMEKKWKRLSILGFY